MILLQISSSALMRGTFYSQRAQGVNQHVLVYRQGHTDKVHTSIQSTHTYCTKVVTEDKSSCIIDIKPHKFSLCAQSWKPVWSLYALYYNDDAQPTTNLYVSTLY